MNTQTRLKSSVLRIDTMNTLTDWIKRHQVAAFFILAYAISYRCSSCTFTVFMETLL
jgi:hypothetical protein